MTDQLDPGLVEPIDQWRAYLAGSRAVTDEDIEELEGHLVDEIRDLTSKGLKHDEAFLIAVKRIGAVDEVSKEYAREHSERLWKQLVLGTDLGSPDRPATVDIAVMLTLAVTAALSIHVPRLFGVELTDGFFVRNVSLFVLPFLAAYFAWKHRVAPKVLAFVAAAFLVAAVVANVFPFEDSADTELLQGLHLPIVLWLVVGIAYAGGEWRSDRRRMDFVRFTGEWFIYYVLIALGGGVLIGLTLAVFEALGLSAETVVIEWLLPSAALGAVLVAAWLVDVKQGVIENIAPVLTRLFTPLFSIALLAFLIAVVLSGGIIDVSREILIIFDLLLVVVLGLLLYTLSARDPRSSASGFDLMQLVLVTAALIIDLTVLVAIVARISEFGFSANKTAALGENLVLLVNLAGAAWLSVGFIRGGRGVAALERWQTRYLTVFAAWAAIVVIAFPPLFGYR